MFPSELCFLPFNHVARDNTNRLYARKYWFLFGQDVEQHAALILLFPLKTNSRFVLSFLFELNIARAATHAGEDARMQQAGLWAHVRMSKKIFIFYSF